MNIFVLDDDPKLAAQYHCDKHCIKMILESAQILCSAFSAGEAPYKRTHYNHPCSIWARESQENFDWLADLAVELCKEYTYRYGKIHKTQAVLDWCIKNKNSITFPSDGFTSFAQAMPDDYMHMDTVKAYRDYYLGEKRGICKWEKARKQPAWFK